MAVNTFETTDTNLSSFLVAGDLIAKPMGFQSDGSFRMDEIASYFNPTDRDFMGRVLPIGNVLPTPWVSVRHGIVAFTPEIPDQHDFFMEVFWVREKAIGIRPKKMDSVVDMGVMIRAWAASTFKNLNNNDAQHEFFTQLPNKPVGLLCVTTEKWENGRYNAYRVSRYIGEPLSEKDLKHFDSSSE